MPLSQGQSQRYSPKLAVAQRYLERRVQEAADAPPNRDRRLPTVRCMAAEARVNPATMAKAVGGLVRVGTLCARPGAGVSVVGQIRGTDAQPPVPDRRCSWQRIRDVLVSEVLSGQMVTGELVPSRKELRARFGAGEMSVGRALAALARTGLVVRQGRGFALSAGPSPGATVVVVTVNEDMTQVTRYTNRAAEFWRTLEHECLRRALDLRVVPYAKLVGRAPLDREARTVVEDRMVAGYLVWSHGLRDEADAVVASLAPYGKPVTVTDEHTGVQISPRVARRTRVTLLPVASDEQAGSDVARFLVEAGHRHIAFFTRNRFDRWAERRMRGLRSCLAAMGRAPGAVRHYDAGIPSEWGEFRSRTAAGPQYREQLARLRVAGRSLGGRGKTSVQEVGGQMLNYLWDEYASSHLVPVFGRAVDDGEATAWVCANDEIGRAAIAYLRQCGVTPGVGLSVVGFDDEIVSSGMGLTSYNFGTAAQAVACIRAIVHPSAARPRSGLIVREIPGFVVRRSSTGVPRQESAAGRSGRVLAQSTPTTGG